MLSFIVPAYNEERFIKRTIESIQTVVADAYEFEIIVVDNASTDNTAKIAREQNAKVLSKPHKYTISAVRNLGVEASQGEVLIFLDGDVYLDHSWIENLPPILEKLLTHRVVTGSVLAVDPEASWVAKTWFEPWFKRQESVTFINSGHMMMSRQLFDEIGGFDESCETGEDHEICQRAKSFGAEVYNHRPLLAFHLGYPNDLGHFFRRERWHGKGNFSPWTRIFASKIPLVVLSIIGSFFLSLVATFLTGQGHFLLVYPIYVSALSAASAYVWLGGFTSKFFPCMFLSWLYFTARCFSLYEVIKDLIWGAKKEKT